MILGGVLRVCSNIPTKTENKSTKLLFTSDRLPHFRNQIPENIIIIQRTLITQLSYHQRETQKGSKYKPTRSCI